MGAERILLVDDEQNARSALRSLLNDEGYEAVAAMKAGAESSLTKPVSIEALLVFLQKAVDKRPATASYVAPGATLRERERDAILRTLAITGGSTVRAAKMLGISARKVQYRVKEYRQTEQLRHDEPEAPADGSKAVA